MKLSVMTIKKLAVAALAVSSLVIIISFPGQSGAISSMSGDAGADYKAKCASCHALDGSGNTAKGKEMKLRDLRSPEVQKLSDAQMLDLIAKGKGKMPGYEKSLGKDKVQQLVAYTRELGKKR